MTEQEYKQHKSHTINHFYEKLLLIGDRMHTKKAREIANQRTSYMSAFLDKFLEEWHYCQQKD
jgi:uncharacterized protein